MDLGIFNKEQEWTKKCLMVVVVGIRLVILDPLPLLVQLLQHNLQRLQLLFLCGFKLIYFGVKTAILGFKQHAVPTVS